MPLSEAKEISYTTLNALCIIASVPYKEPSNKLFPCLFILQMKKLRLSKVEHARSHKSADLNSDPKFMPSTQD